MARNNYENGKENLKTDGGFTADAAEAECDSAVTGLGKFKDVKTLIKAYSELEAEFTRRSQRLKELESGNKTEALPDGEKASSSTGGQEFLERAVSDARVRDAVISDYLKSLQTNTAVPVTAGGGGVIAPRTAPKTVKEAGRLAREFLKG